MKNNEAASVLLIAVSVLFFYAVLQAEISGVYKFAVEIGLLSLCGMGLQKLLKLEGMYGGLIFRTTRGIATMDGLSRWKPEFWKAIADLGIAMGFGISAVFLYKRVPNYVYIFGIFALIASTQVMMPKVFEVISSVISLPMEMSAQSEAGSVSFAVTQIVVVLATLFFGLGGMTISAILLNGLKILYLVVSYLLNPASVDLGTATPGAGPALPGITMPLFEGILALAILLVVHEASHGILSRIAKVKIESCGVLLFGFIPVGAFVDPDEKQLAKCDKEAQTRVFAAGAAANISVFLLLFFALIAFEIVFYPGLTQAVIVGTVLSNSSAQLANITSGTEIYSINGMGV
ncbi:MAG: site-2 protease family protein, partial [Candidatus Micrarchaeota archaeon]|nr:site-2 protease family protein [Candidatus Micrarchaeota archaeon]